MGTTAATPTSPPRRRENTIEVKLQNIEQFFNTMARSNRLGRESASRLSLNQEPVALDWPALINTLAPNGRIHFVRAVTDPIPVSRLAVDRGAAKSLGFTNRFPTAIATMLEFAAQHSAANRAFSHEPNQ